MVVDVFCMYAAFGCALTNEVSVLRIAGHQGRKAMLSPVPNHVRVSCSVGWQGFLSGLSILTAVWMVLSFGIHLAVSCELSLVCFVVQ